MVILLTIAMISFIFIETSQALSLPSFGLYRKDQDIQDGLVGITLHLERRKCPVVVIHDVALPKPALNRILRQFQKQESYYEFASDSPSVFIILDLTTPLKNYLTSYYNSSDPAEIILKFLHILYRRSECYTFIIWIHDPKILEFPSVTTINPGWRKNDVVLLPTHHTGSLYRSLTSQTFWNDIPHIIALKRKYDGVILASKEIRVYTVLPYYSQKRLRKSQELDVWLIDERRFVFNRPLFFDKFRSFNGIPLMVGMFWKEPFLIFGDIENPYLDGLDWRLLGLCTKKLNFSVSVKSFQLYGRPLENGMIWSGMMGGLKTQVIDFGIGGVAMYSERMEAFGFTKTYFTDSFAFACPLSATTSSTWKSLIFQPLVWKMALFTLVTASVTLKFIAEMNYKLQECFDKRFSLTTFNGNYHKTEASHFLKMINILGFMLTVLCQKPYKHSPKSLPEQLAFNAIILGNFIMGIVFSSCLIVYLFKFKHQPLADSIGEILPSGLPINLQFYDGYLDYLFETSKDPTIQQIFQKSTRVKWNGTEINSTSSLDSVVLGKSIHIDSSSRLKFTGKYRYKGKKGLKFHVGSQNIIDHVDIGWPVRKNWPFTKKFDDIINRAVEHGFVQHWMQRLMQGEFGWDNEAYKIPDLYSSYLRKRIKRVKDFDPTLTLDQKFIPLSISHLKGVIYLYVSGVLAAFIAFIGERLVALAVRNDKIWNVCRISGKESKSKCLHTDKMKKSSKIVTVERKKLEKTKRHQIKNELNEIFRLHKNQKLSNVTRTEVFLLWSDFNHCFDKTLQTTAKKK